jgi:tungstate transport system ATP-binding protein
MTGSHSLLELAGVQVERGGVEVLDVPAFGLGEGELVTLIGENGSGKSTLLLTMMLLLPRSAGEVRWRGRPVASNGTAIACRRRMAMVFQEPYLLDATVSDNVASGLRLRGMGRADVRLRVKAYLDRFHLSGLADRSALKLSGGEARRVNLARALAVEPEVLFLDEPFSNLDGPTRRSITDDLWHALRQNGTTAVLVTHDTSEALRLSDRIVVMHGGKIVQSDVPAAVMSDPADAFVASWAGMESILEGVVRHRSGSEIVVAVGEATVDAVGDAAPGDPVYCCIRPESVTIDAAASRTSSARNVFPAVVVSAVSVGPFFKVKLDCGFPLLASVTRESHASLSLTPGARVFASFKATGIHVIRRTEAARR